jgi:hypothetical protein
VSDFHPATAEARLLASYEGWLDDRLKSATFRQAQIVSYSSATGLATIQLGGDTNQIAGVPHAASYTPSSGDTGVWALMLGTSPLLVFAVDAPTQLDYIRCTSGARPAHREGRMIYETDTDDVQTSDGSAWNPIVGGARGLVVPKEVWTTNFNFTTQSTMITLDAFTLISGRSYCATAVWRSLTGTGGEVAEARILQDGTQIQAVSLGPLSGTGLLGGSFSHPFDCPADVSAGSHTYSLAWARSAGANTVTVQCAADRPVTFRLEDIGPTP